MHKRIMSIAIAVLLVLSMAACGQPQATTGNPASDAGIQVSVVTVNEKHTIPFPEEYDITSEGASSYMDSGDHFDSVYFSHPDYYNMKSGKGLTILSNFATYQQTTEWSCGPASILMLLHYYGIDEYKELDIADLAQGRNKGASPAELVRFFEAAGMDYDTSPSGFGQPDAPTFTDPDAFTDWAIASLTEGTPILLDWPDWDGHWQVMIGYDTMGTDGIGDDVLILADPYDTSDHYQDGYMAVSAERFFYMWHSGDGFDTQPWVTAKPKV